MEEPTRAPALIIPHARALAGFRGGTTWSTSLIPAPTRGLEHNPYLVIDVKDGLVDGRGKLHVFITELLVVCPASCLCSIKGHADSEPSSRYTRVPLGNVSQRLGCAAWSHSGVPGPSRSNGSEPGFPKPRPGVRVPRAPGAPGTRSRGLTHLSPGMDTVDHWKIRAVRARSTTPLNITSFASTRALRNSLAARKARKEANLLGCAWQYDRPRHSNQKDAKKSTNPRGACVQTH